MPLRIERISELGQLSLHQREQWDRLPMPSPMQSADWLLHWWQAFGDSSKANQLCLALVYDDNRLVAVAPWYIQHAWPQGNRLRFLGDGLACSDHATIVIQSGYEQRVVACLASWLRHNAHQQWQTICFESITDGNQPVRRLLKELASAGCDQHLRDVTGSWAVELPQTWDEFLGQLSKNHRKRCRRWQRKYFDSGRAKICRLSAATVDRGWRQISRLNQIRREQVGDRSAFLDPRFHAFHQAALETLVAKGKAELRELRIDDRLVASEYVLVHEGTVFCYQSGMETSDQRDGFGNLSILGLFQLAIADGCNRLDFLRGDEDYKQHWGAKRVGAQNYFLAPKSLTGSAHVTYFRAVDWMRSIKNTLTGPTA